MPATLPRIEIEILPDEVIAAGVDNFERIGQDTSEILERRTAAFVVVKVVRPKFVRKDRPRNDATAVHIAPPVAQPMERGLAGPSLLAETIVKRWQDHLPLARQEQIWAREGIALAKSTMCAWHAALANLCTSLVGAMWDDALAQPYLCTDATGLLVRAPDKCKHGHFWVVVAPQRHVLYRYSPAHNMAAVDAMLGDYQGFLVADAHNVYDHLYRGGKVIEVACWAHARRYFYKLLDEDLGRASTAIVWIGKLFDLERQWKQLSAAQRHTARHREARQVVDGFEAWCDAQSDAAVEGTLLAKALRYVRNQRAALRRFLDDGRLPLHNNDSERALRRQVIGRKNWLFCGNDDGARVNTVFVTLLASAQMHALNPATYLRDLFCLLPDWTAADVFALAPCNWRRTLEQPETQRRLAAHVVRNAVVAGDAPSAAVVVAVNP